MPWSCAVFGLKKATFVSLEHVFQILSRCVWGTGHLRPGHETICAVFLCGGLQMPWVCGVDDAVVGLCITGMSDLRLKPSQ